jgi:hypothetical protein
VSKLKLQLNVVQVDHASQLKLQLNVVQVDHVSKCIIFVQLSVDTTASTYFSGWTLSLSYLMIVSG